MTEGDYGTQNGLQDEGVFIPVSDHLEPFSKTHNLRVHLDSAGRKKASIESITPGQFPAKATISSPNEFMTWNQAREKIGQLVKAKSL